MDSESNKQPSAPRRSARNKNTNCTKASNEGNKETATMKRTASTTAKKAKSSNAKKRSASSISASNSAQKSNGAKAKAKVKKSEIEPPKKEKLPEPKRKKEGSHPVDHDVPQASTYTVVQMPDTGLWCDAILNQCNINNNNNKFYRLQLLQKNGVSNHYSTWFKWGRVGERNQSHFMGGPFPSINQAYKEFCKKYRSKTGNAFGAENFVPKKNKYTPLEIDNDVEVPSDFKADNTYSETQVEYLPSKLDPQTKDLIDVLFSKETRNTALTSFHLDLARLPLGVPSTDQIQIGVSILNKIEEKLDGTRMTEDFNDLSSQFYTAIPHSFGRSRPPCIQTQEFLQQRYDMCNILLDMYSTNETMRKIQEERKAIEKKQFPCPSDSHYDSLNADLKILQRNSQEYKTIQSCFNKTKTANSSSKLLDVWCVDRSGEAENFQKFDKLGNRRLLWHGTNIAVVAPILTSGLRIMPHSGGRVGSGIYLAAMQEKSASYTSAYGAKYGCMLLAEAALGSMHEVTEDGPHASRLKKAPKGYDSVHALGTTVPEKWIDVHIDEKNIKVGEGKKTEKDVKSSFYHDEFLVYDESQVRIRYVLSVKL
jgi:poly [ADP-ribose] polymerase